MNVVYGNSSNSVYWGTVILVYSFFNREMLNYNWPRQKFLCLNVVLSIHISFHNSYCSYTVVCNALRYRPASLAQLDAPSDWRPGGRGFNPRRGQQHSFVKIDHEIFSTVILSLPLIQEGQLSVSGERMCTVLVNRLED